MANQTISRDNLKAIYDIACPNWKIKLAEYAKRSPFENEITLNKSEIDEMFKSSDSKQTILLKKYFLTPLDIKDSVKSFEDACKVLNYNPKSVFSPTDDKNDIAFKKLKIIIKALNEGWYPNWDNVNEKKYYNYFKMNEGFSYWLTYCSLTFAYGPSVLFLKTKDLAIYAAEIALEEYKEYYA